MRPPTQAQLRAGVLVNIILKADQPTGKLTTGSIADILTRTNHPRGIKVRLSDGQIGRVQSLVPLGVHSYSSSSIEPRAPSTQTPVSLGGNPLASRLGGHMTSLSSTMRDQTEVRMQEDYRNDPTPAETATLEQYIKKPTQKKKKKGKSTVGGTRDTAAASEGHLEEQSASTIQEAVQTRLEAEFPDLDNAVITAIVRDYYDDIEETRKVLTAVNTS